MWLLHGRYAEDSRDQVSKLLKNGQSYTIGRKIPADIVVDSKFVSRISCHITVGPSPHSDRPQAFEAAAQDPALFHSDLQLRPKVTVRFEANKSRKSFPVLQQSRHADASNLPPTEVQVPADQEFELNHGDSFALTTTISLKLVWRPIVVCFAARVKESSIAPLRSTAGDIGVYLSPAKSRWRTGFTHLCVHLVKPTESVIGALVQARPIVSIDYFTQLFQRANSPRHDPNSLETRFPDEIDYASCFPEISQEELGEMDNMFRKIQPDEKRTYMLRGTTCVFFALPSDDGELTIYRAILALAGAKILVHNPEREGLRTKSDFTRLLMSYKNTALSYWRNSGSKARNEAPDDGLVVLSNAAHDSTDWKIACAATCADLRIAMPPGLHAITNAIFNADVRGHLNIIPAGEGDDTVDDDVRSQIDSQSVAAAAADTVEETRQSAANAEAEPPENEQRRAAHPPSADAAPAPAAQDALDRNLPAAQRRAETHTPAADSAQTSTQTATRRPLTRRTQRTHAVDAIDELLGSSHVELESAPSTDIQRQARQPTESMRQSEVRQHRQNERVLSESATLGGAEQSSQMQPSQASRMSGGSRLTRRTGSNRTASRRSDIFDSILRGAEAEAASMNDAAGRESNIQTRPSGTAQESFFSSVPKSRRFRMDLDEEDRAESQTPAQAGTEVSSGLVDAHDDVRASTPAGGAKRKQPGNSVNADQQEGEETSGERRKRVRTASINDIDIVDDSASAALHAPVQQSQHPGRAQRISTQAGTTAMGLENGAGPDTEPRFLEALGVQRAQLPPTHDDFDTEFNRLSLAKTGGGGGTRKGKQQQTAPAIRPIDEDYEAFKRMAEEELRIHARGNFIQVDFVPLVRQRKAVEASPTPAPSVDGAANARPNFKKFRPKPRPGQPAVSLSTTPNTASPATSTKPRIAMHLTENQDFGLGGAYWTGTDKTKTADGARLGDDEEIDELNSIQPRDAATGGLALSAGRVSSNGGGGGVNLNLEGLDSMDDEEEQDISTLLARQNQTRRGTKRARPAMRLGLNDDDDEGDLDGDGGGEVGGQEVNGDGEGNNRERRSQLPSRKSQRTATTGTQTSTHRARSRAQPAVADSDSDERSNVVLLSDNSSSSGDDNDEDDNDGNFAGFGSRSGTVRRRGPSAAAASRAPARRSGRSAF
ncbi:hypothetical protein BCV70DRAFT_199416 [Testicularia cyperi]|uniref:FHA domain-containing protein n=1 Tax=Testicularia cyperi TaxID=1882483 RepID=A0A317XS31_9BASI|nr:hypothetical protein BCV70DRAFT_199416 [Testicularia cyperi]